MVNEMLLNNGVQKKMCSNDFTLSKGNKCNIIEKKIKLNFNHFIWTRFQ